MKGEREKLVHGKVKYLEIVSENSKFAQTHVNLSLFSFFSRDIH